MTQAKLIIIDDEPGMGQFISDVAEKAGFTTEIYYRADRFQEYFDNSADVIVLDLILPETDGVELIRYLANVKCHSSLVLISGFDTGVLHSAQQLAIEQGLNVIGSLSKPFRYEELQSLITNLNSSVQDTPSNKYDQTLLSQELRLAIRKKEIKVYYQPQINLNNKSLVGVEALVRWQHKGYGLLLPKQFLHLAMQDGLMDDLTWCVLLQALQQLKQWNKIEDLAELSISVNMSASTLKHLSLPERISGLLSEFKIAPKQLVLEVTESELMQELVKSLDILTRLRMKGFRLSIDDFGTGYSSMMQLHRVPFSEIKVDRSFVNNMCGDREAEAIVETIIMLGHKLNMTVVAEGVETPEVYKRLREMNCDLVQGFHISQPMDAEQVLPWLQENMENASLHM